MEEPENEEKKDAKGGRTEERGEKQKDSKTTSNNLGLNSDSEVEVDTYPVTPERMPPGSTTPPPGTSKGERRRSTSKRMSGKRRTRSLDRNNSPSSTSPSGSPGPGDGDICAICLGKLQDKAKTDTCLHEFCFTCLVEWSKVKPVCPLCKSKFSHIMHNIISDTEYSRYNLPPEATREEIDINPADFNQFFFSNRRFFSYHSSRVADQLSRRRRYQLHNYHLPAGPSSGRDHFRRRRGPGASDFRRHIYQDDLWVEPMADVTGRYRNCSPEWYRTNEAQIHRLIPFLNRELLALLQNGPHVAQQAHLLQQIQEWVTRYEIQGPEMRDNLLPYLGIRTEHFQHEFYNFARSTFDLVGYDRNAEYQPRQLPAAQVVSSESDSEIPPLTSGSPTEDNNRTMFSEEIPAFNVIQSSFQVLNADDDSSLRRHRSSRKRERRSGSLDRRRARSAERDRRDRHRHRGDRDRHRQEDWRLWRERQRERLEGRHPDGDSRHGSGSRHSSSDSRQRSSKDRRSSKERRSSKDRSSRKSSKDRRERRSSKERRSSDEQRRLHGKSSRKDSDSRASTSGSSASVVQRSCDAFGVAFHNRRRGSSSSAGSGNPGPSGSSKPSTSDPLRPFPATSASTSSAAGTDTQLNRERSPALADSVKFPPALEERMRLNSLAARQDSEEQFLARGVDLLSTLRQTLQETGFGTSGVLSSPTEPAPASNSSGASKPESSKEPERKKEKSKRKSSKPSRYLRHQQDIAKNFPHLLPDDDCPVSGGQEVVTLSPTHPVHSIDLTTFLETSRAALRAMSNSSTIGNDLHETIDLGSPPSKHTAEKEKRSNDDVIDVGSPMDLSLRGVPGTSSGLFQDRNTEYQMRSLCADSSDEENPVKNPLKTIPPGFRLSEQTGLPVPISGNELVMDLKEHNALSRQPVIVAGPSTAFNPTNTTLSESSEDELAIVDEVQHRQKKQKEPEIVELSDSDTEVNVEVDVDVVPEPQQDIQVASSSAQTGAGGFADECIEISSGSDDDTAGISDFRIPSPPPNLISPYEQHNYWESSWGMNAYASATIEAPPMNYDNMGPKKKGRGKNRKAATPEPESSDDDLIVVKTEYNTVDPITKKEIVEPVKNKLCGHIYEKSAMHSMIDLARSQSKPVKCPYVGCNQRDFTKKDLLKDKDVKEHIEKIQEERVEEARVKKEKEDKKRKLKAERKSAGGDHSDSTESIIEDVEMIVEDSDNEKEKEKAVVEESGSSQQVQQDQQDQEQAKQLSNTEQQSDISSSSSDTSLPSMDSSNSNSSSSNHSTQPSSQDGMVAVDVSNKDVSTPEDGNNEGEETDQMSQDQNQEDERIEDEGIDLKQNEEVSEKNSDPTNDLESEKEDVEENVVESDENQTLTSRAGRKKRKRNQLQFFASDSDSEDDQESPTVPVRRRPAGAQSKDKRKRPRKGTKVTIKKVTETFIFEEKEKERKGKGKKASPNKGGGGEEKSGGTKGMKSGVVVASTSAGGKRGKGRPPLKKGKGKSCGAGGKGAKVRPRRATQAATYTETTNSEQEDEEEEL